MNKPKEKAQEQSVVSNKALENAFAKKSLPENAENTQQATMLAIWKEEVAGLMSRDFKNMEEALAVVVSNVGDRLGASAEERGFLMTLLSTDPTIAAELRRSLRIKQG